MKRSSMNLGQLVIAILGIVFVSVLPFACFRLGALRILQSSGLQLAVNVNMVFLLLYVVLAVEVIIAFSGGNQTIALGTSVVGMIIGVIFWAAIARIAENGNFMWILRDAQRLLSYLGTLPESVRGSLPTEINADNIEALKLLISQFYKVDIGFWAYIISQILFLVSTLMTQGSNKSSNTSSTPSSC